METLRIRKITSILESDTSFHPVTNHEIRADRGVLIRDYPGPIVQREVSLRENYTLHGTLTVVFLSSFTKLFDCFLSSTRHF